MPEQEQAVIIVALNAIQHYQEYIDTGAEVDLLAARNLMANSSCFMQYVEDSAVLLPLRRDGRTLAQCLLEDRL